MSRIKITELVSSGPNISSDYHGRTFASDADLDQPGSTESAAIVLYRRVRSADILPSAYPTFSWFIK
jgi:hypothetical protein